MDKLSVPATFSSITDPEHGKDSVFERELCSFLAELTKTSDMSSLENNLSRLKLAMMEEVSKTDSSGQGFAESGINSPIASPERSMNSTTDSSGSSSPSSLGDTSSTDPSDNSLSSSPPRQVPALSSSGHDVSLYSKATRQLMFSIQSGARFDLKEDQLRDIFSKYGKVVQYRLHQNSRLGFDGFVEFSSSLVAASLVNTVVTVGDCQLHCSVPWESLTSQPVPHQILLESRYLPHVWERDMIVRSFFSKYGLVTGVSMIGYTSGKLLRYVISFKDPNPAMDLIGSWIKILSATVWVREVTGETIFPRDNQVSRERPRASNLPWRQ